MVNFMETAYMAIAFVVFVVTLGVGGTVLFGIQDTQYNLTVTGCTLALARAGQANCTTAASNASLFGLQGINNVSNQAGVIGTILAATIMLGLLMTAFVLKRD